MIPERLELLAKATAGHGNKIPYVSCVMPFTTANFILNIAAFCFSGNDCATFRAALARLVGTQIVTAVKTHSMPAARSGDPSFYHVL